MFRRMRDDIDKLERYMAASDQTVRDVLTVVQNHVKKEQLQGIVKDLMEVPGNQSFRETIVKMAKELGIQRNSSGSL